MNHNFYEKRKIYMAIINFTVSLFGLSDYNPYGDYFQGYAQGSSQ